MQMISRRTVILLTVLVTSFPATAAPPTMQVLERRDLPGGLVRERLRLPGFDPDEAVPAIAIHPGSGGRLPVCIVLHPFRGAKENNVLVRIDPKDARVYVVGKIEPLGRPTFVGRDMYLSGPEQLRRIRNIGIGPPARQKSL